MKNIFLSVFILLVFIANSQAKNYQGWIESNYTPVLSGSATWEGTSIQEPRAIQISSNNFMMIYTGYNFGTGLTSLGLATSTDGLNWTKYASNPLIGNGNCSEAGNAQHTGGIYSEGGLYYIFYTNGTSQGGNLVAQQITSSGGCSNKTTVLNATTQEPAGGEDFANSCVIKVGSTYHLFVEVKTALAGNYRLFHATSSSLLSGYTFSPNAPLLTLSLNSNYTSSGPSAYYLNGKFYLWFHSGNNGTPTDAYFSSSPDAQDDWTKPILIFSRANEINLQNFGGHALDQIADPNIIDGGFGTVYAYYDRDWSESQISDIAAQTFPGNLTSLIFPIRASIKNATIRNASL